MRSTTKKFFGAAVFQKCCRGVGEQPTFAKQIKLYDEKEQKSKSKSEESQLLLKLEGCKYGKRFQGKVRFPGKLGMCPSLAEPDWGGFPKRIVFSYKPQANKSFSVQQFFKNVGEVWASNVINLKRLLNGKQNVWKYQNGEEKSDSDGREKDV